MESMVRELRKIVRFKKTTEPGDILLVAVEETESVFYALLTDIEPDSTHRAEWWELTMQVLNVPPQQVIWTLREPQFTGKETFTMNGKGRFVQAVSFTGPPPDQNPKPLHKKPSGPRPHLKRIK